MYLGIVVWSLYAVMSRVTRGVDDDTMFSRVYKVDTVYGNSYTIVSLCP